MEFIPAGKTLNAHQPASALTLAFLIMSVQFLPSLPLYFEADTSMALGTAAAALMIILFFVATQATAYRFYAGAFGRIAIVPFAIAATIVLCAIPHAALADHFLPIDLARLFKTLPLLFLLLASGMVLGKVMAEANDGALRRALHLSFLIFFLSVLFRIAGLQPPTGGNFPKSTFPFTETSHFALAFAPVLLYKCVTSAGTRQLGWLFFGFAIAVGLESATLLFGCLLAAIVCRRILLVTLAGTVLALGVVPFGLEYFTSRLDLSEGGSNISTLVYIQGWQILQESLARSFGWGVGFQQMGIHGTQVSAADTLLALSGADPTNVMDGSFVFAKLGAELGVFGLLLGIVFLIAAVRSVRALRNDKERVAITFARCVLVTFIVDMFVRGTGYFAGSTLLAIACGCVLAANSRWRWSERKARIQAIPA
jgi:hypothetical protein